MGGGGCGGRPGLKEGCPIVPTASIPPPTDLSLTWPFERGAKQKDAERERAREMELRTLSRHSGRILSERKMGKTYISQIPQSYKKGKLHKHSMRLEKHDYFTRPRSDLCNV